VKANFAKNVNSCFGKLKFLYFYIIKENMQALFNLFSKSRSFRKAIALVGVYTIHLVCLQTLMQAAPIASYDNSFKPLFSHHEKAPAGNNQKPNHPAVTYYTQLMKQGKDVRTLCQLVPALNQLAAVLPATPHFLSNTFRLYQADFSSLHLADDSFKLYRLIQVFLI
jgi:hypothetical protein